MKKIARRTAICCALFVVLCVFCATICACDDMRQNRGRQINSVNHRGYSAEAPENTLAAYRLSKEKGFVFVECDIAFTKDNVPVLLHDETVNRTSNGKGAICDLTLAEVKTLDFGSWKSAKYAQEKIATLEEFLALCKELQLSPYLELKKSAIGKDKIDLLAQMVWDSGLDVTWIVWQTETAQRLLEHFPNGRVGLLCEVVSQNKIDAMLAMKTPYNQVFLDVNYALLTSSYIRMCKKSKMPLEVWTVNDKSNVANINPYISGVTSDSIHAQQLFETL